MYMRDLFIIIGMCVAAIGIGTWLYFYVPIAEPTVVQTTEIQPTSVPATTGVTEAVSFVEIAKGSNATGVVTRKNYAIYSADEFEKIWKQTGSIKPRPEVDFTKNYVIAVFEGKVPSGGYSISVTGVMDTADERSVAIHVTKPGKGCLVNEALALSSPYQIITVPLTGGTLSHTDTESEVDCSTQ